MEENIKKPITMVRQELIDAISWAINTSNLPLFVVESILKDVYMEVKTLSQRQYEIDKEQYESRLKADNNDETE